MKAIIAGTSLFSSTLFQNWDEVAVDTPYGKTSVHKASQYLFLQRHGKKQAAAPQRSPSCEHLGLKEPRSRRRDSRQLRRKPQDEPEARYLHHSRRFRLLLQHSDVFRLRDAIRDPGDGCGLRPENAPGLHRNGDRDDPGRRLCSDHGGRASRRRPR